MGTSPGPTKDPLHPGGLCPKQTIPRQLDEGVLTRPEGGRRRVTGGGLPSGPVGVGLEETPAQVIQDFSRSWME